MQNKQKLHLYDHIEKILITSSESSSERVPTDPRTMALKFDTLVTSLLSCAS